MEARPAAAEVVAAEDVSELEGRLAVADAEQARVAEDASALTHEVARLG